VATDAALAIAAPAKINLFLHVLGRRDDGYHRLDSLIGFVEIGDSIEVAPAPDLALAIEGPFAAGLSAGEDNLVLRAARALSAAAGGRVPGAAIRLIKNLPLASGIGGGSSDAAATLKALDSLWRLSLGDPALGRLGLALGADVPVCLLGRTARVGGIGDALAPADPLPAFGVLLVNPLVPVPTAAVFGALHGRYTVEAPAAPVAASAREFARWLGRCRNDLAAPALEIAPVVGEVLDALASAKECLLARLSGSGATCFALFPDIRFAEAAAEDLKAAHPGWWIDATRFRRLPPAVELIADQRR
jgi:4-diphosphocytidyl-2-C-methyl-D-erythritol kinase